MIFSLYYDNYMCNVLLYNEDVRIYIYILYMRVYVCIFSAHFGILDIVCHEFIYPLFFVQILIVYKILMCTKNMMKRY